MSDGTAVAKTPEELKKEAEQKVKDEAATELLKELDDLEADDDKDKDKSDTKTDDKAANDDTGDGQDGKGETSEGDESDDATGSQSEGSKSKGRKGFKRRVDRLTKKNAVATAENGELASKLRTSDEKIKLLELRLQQKGDGRTLEKPNPDKFDLGEEDGGFIKAKDAYDEAILDAKVAKRVQEATKAHGQQQSIADQKNNLERKQETHWENADKLDVDDYDEKEVAVVKVIGTDMVNNIIDYFPADSHNLMYYLGTNTSEAEDIAELLADRTGPGMVQGVAELGKIIEKIKVKPIKSKIKPDPDVDTRGSESSPQDSLQQRLDALRDDAVKTGRKDGMKRILEFKRKARARGIALT